jgi:hypothetical protein
MLWRAAIVVVGGGYVAYRLWLAVQIARAKRAGDRERERRLRTLSFRLLRWAFACLLVFIVALTLLVWSNSR